MRPPTIQATASSSMAGIRFSERLQPWARGYLPLPPGCFATTGNSDGNSDATAGVCRRATWSSAMPTARTSEDTRKSPARKSAKQDMDAIQLLRADHRQVEEWFEQFESSRSEKKKIDLAHKICTALTVHTMIEEEIFYPAYLEATGDEEMHDEAHVE